MRYRTTRDIDPGEPIKAGREMKLDADYLRDAIDEVCGQCPRNGVCYDYAKHRAGREVAVQDLPDKCQAPVARMFERIWVPPHHRPL